MNSLLGLSQTLPVTVSINAVKDNTIYQRDATKSNGAGEFFIAGTTGSPYFNRALIKFDIASQIPAGAIIQHARLTLHLANSSVQSGPYNIELHKLLQDWGEGTSNAGTQAGQGAPATTNDATWANTFYPSSNWASPGGNFSSINSAVQAVDEIGFYSWTSSGMVSDIQQWLNNASVNYGWLIKSEESSSFQAKKFESRENTIVANRPVLTITYIPKSSNLPPRVSINSPINNSVFPAGSIITLNAIVSDTDGSIIKVEFYNSGIKFLEDTIAPYGLTSNEAAPGNYALTAKAFDNLGATSVSDTVKITVTACVPLGSISGQGYTNIPGTQVTDLTANLAYPDSPYITAQLNSFEYASVGDNYGGRLRGYICAPQTGNYTFYIASDDQAGLWLSSDDNPSHKVLVAYNISPVGFRDWTNTPTQKSAPVKLIRGARYYIETLHKQSTGNNYLSMGWVLPDGTGEGPIPGSRLSPWGSSRFTVAGGRALNFSQAMERNKPDRLQVTVSPNPSPNYFNITIRSNRERALTINVVDLMGRVVERRLNTASNGTLRLGSQLPAGVYFAEIIQGAQKERLKLVKQ